MRCLAAAVMLAGCLRATTISCPSGAECPAGYACTTAAPYCAPERQVAACAGEVQFNACMTDSPGVCYQGVCTPCSADLAGCATMGWAAMTSPTLADLNAVWMNNSTDAHAVGNNATVLDYDGRSWKADDAFSSAYASETPSRVWEDADGTLFVLGARAVYRRDPSRAWSVVPGFAPPPNFAPGAISGVSAHDLVVVGQGPTLLHFDGAMWQSIIEPTSSGGTTYSGIWHGAWYDGTQLFVGGSGDALTRHAGGSWDALQPLGTSGTWTSLAAENGIVFAVGAASSTQTNIARYANGAWTADTVAMDPITDLDAVAGVSAATIFAVGKRHIATMPLGVILRSETGTSWSVDATPTDEITGVAEVARASSGIDAMVVGRGGVILRYVGP